VITGTSDPGYLPRLPHPGPTPDGRARPRYREEIVEGTGKAVTVKWNDTCNFYQPPRAHHCSVNDDCVDKFDHHCPWVGTTIGRRNYRTFLFFVFGTLLMCVYVVCVCALQIQIKRDDLAAGTENRTTKVRSIHRSPYDRVGVVNADP
jgi:palmitoyltransferase ZDHHC9/14/18